MKETKEMMKTLTENKKKIQIQKMELKRVKEHSLDILKTIWLCVACIIIVKLISLI